MAIKILHRRDTAANFTINNPTVNEGELCFETDTNKIKIGDGVTTWSSLPYITEQNFTGTLKSKLDGIETAATADQTGAEIKAAYEAEADTNGYTDAEKSKLSGIETSADVTDTINVTAAGALMDSEVTNLADVKAFATTDYATAAQGTTADNALPKAGGALTGAVTTTSTFDGRDVATDGTKLDGIETGADVTDTTNVAAAGAVMESDTSTALMSFVVDEDTMTSDLDTKVPTQQSVKAYVDAEVATAVASEMSFKGDYNASTNSPDLDVSPSGIGLGDMYVVTAAGNFFATAVEVGDTLISKQLNPTLVGHWSIVNRNLDDASIKVAYENNADTNAYTDAEQTKVGFVSVTQAVDLDTIESDTATNNAKVSNVTTNLGYTASTRTVTSSDGTDAVLTEVVAAGNSGLMTGSDKTKLDGIASGADVTSSNETSHADVVVDGDFTANGILTRTGAGAYSTTTDNSSDWDTAFTHTSSTSNPHSVTASQVGLGNVTNESKATMFTDPSLTGTTSLVGVTETQIAKTATFTPSFTEGTVFNVTSGTVTLNAPTATAGKSFTVISQAAATLSFSATYKWSGGTVPTVGAGIDVYTFVSDGTNWYGFQGGTEFA